MEIGMLWYDNDPDTSLAEKVAGAAAYYRAKYGAVPNYVHVHPAQADGDGNTEIEGVRIVADPHILQNHFWIGTELENNEWQPRY